MSSTDTPIRLLGGIDPGLASGGFVVSDFQDRMRVLEALSLVEERGTVSRSEAEAKRLSEAIVGWGDKEFLAADLRARAWVQRFGSTLDAIEAEYGRIDKFAIESFVDQAQHAKKMMAKRWQTPLVTGYLLAALERRGYTSANGGIVFQNAGVVLKQFEDERDRLKARTSNDRDLIVPGDRLVTNGHTRSALSHVLALGIRLREAVPATATTTA